MTKPTRSRKPKATPRNVLADLAALGPDMAALAAAFEMRKPDAMERAAFLREVECGKKREAHRAARVPGADRKAQAVVIRRHGRRAAAIETVTAHYARVAQTWREDEGPTPEKRLQKAWDRDPIIALLDTGRITPDHASAARHMAWVVLCVTTGSWPRIGKLEPTPGAPRDSGWRSPGMSQRAATAKVDVYDPWIEEMQRRGMAFAPVLDVCVFDQALNTVAGRHRMGWRKMARLLKEALALYDARLRSHGTREDREFAMADIPAHLLQHKELGADAGQTQHA